MSHQRRAGGGVHMYAPATHARTLDGAVRLEVHPSSEKVNTVFSPCILHFINTYQFRVLYLRRVEQANK